MNPWKRSMEFKQHRAAMVLHQKGLCFYCQVPMTAPGLVQPDSATLDHVRPRKGKLHQHTINGPMVAACRACNLARGDAPFALFLFKSNAKLMGAS